MAEPDDSAAITKARVVTMLKYPLPDSSVSFERHQEIVKAYVVLSHDGRDPVGYKEVGKVTVSPARVSGNVKFFEHMGLLKKVEGLPGKHVPTPEAISIRRDLDWNKESNVKNTLASLLLTSWFWLAARDLLAIRAKTSEDELIQHLGREAGADPKKHSPALKTIVSYLKFAGLLVQQEDGMLALNTEVGSVEGGLTDKGEPGKMITPPPREQVSRGISPEKPSMVLGVFVSPEMTEDQVRRTVRIVLEEIGKDRSDSEG